MRNATVDPATSTTPDPEPRPASRRSRSRRAVVIIAVAVVVVVPIVAYGYLAWSTSDAPPPASIAVAGASSAGGPATPTGSWTVVPAADIYAGYRIRERMGPVSAPSDAVGRSSGIEGTLAIDGRSLTGLDVTIDLRTLTSDASRRDEILRTAALETDSFPTAKVTVVEPVTFGTVARGQLVQVDIPTQITLHGVTKPVTFHIQARWNGGTIQVAGTADITRSDFGIVTGNLAGFNLAETATIEFETTFAPTGTDGASEATHGSLVPRNNTATASDDIVPCVATGPVPTVSSPLLFTTFDGNQVVAVTTTGDLRSVFRGTDVGSVAWMPDTSSIVMATGIPPNQPRRISTVPAIGGQPTEIGALGDAVQPDVAADGSIAYVKPSPDGTSELWITRPGGNDPAPLVTGAGTVREPRWSADGQWIAFSQLCGPSNQDVRIVRRDGTGLRSLASSPGYEYAPSFTPDGSHVLFSRDGAIFSVAIDDTGLRELTNGHQDTNPSMSPDGSKLAFVRDGSIVIADPNGGGPQCLPTGVGIGSGPRWAPR